jgi:magnesium chelatase family protein
LLRTGQPNATGTHRGALLLDQAPEFHRNVLDALRQPLESGEVIIERAGAQAVFPARFMLVLTALPCPCAKSAELGNSGCSCSPAALRGYMARLSGPLLDRIDVKVRLQPASRSGMLPGSNSAEPSSVVAQRVAAARKRTAARLAGTPWHLNGEVPGAVLRRSFPPTTDALRLLDRLTELGLLSHRAASGVVRVARSLADLRGSDRPGPDDIDRTAGWRLGTAP